MPTIEARCSALATALILVIILTQVGIARGQQPEATPPTNLEQRVRDLEETVRRLEAERKPDTPAPEVKQSAPEVKKLEAKEEGASRSVLAGWDDTFFLRSADRKYNVRITGQIQADYRGFLDNGDATDIDTFLIRRARLGIEADMFQYYEFRLLPDFGQGQVRLQDAYVNVHYWDAFQFEAGKFKQPVSYEQLIQDRFVPTMERSILDQLVPSRDTGVMIHGQKLFGDRLDYAVAVADGEINGDTDTNNRKDVSARVVLRPFNDPEGGALLRGLQIGVSGSVGIEQELVNPQTLRTPATVPFFQYNATVRADGLRTRWTPEVSYFLGPLGLAAQYLGERQRLSPSSTLNPYVDVSSEGFYVLATLLLTGETRTTYSKAVDPLRPFDPRCPLACPGAWELVGRVSQLHVGNVVFAPGAANLANPALYSSGATELTLGFNWYLNKWVRTQFNWEHAWFNSPVRLGPGPAGLLRQQDSLLTRFQVIF